MLLMYYLLVYSAIFGLADFANTWSNSQIYFIDKINKTLKGTGFQQSPVVDVIDLSNFTCDILTVVSIWDCKLIIIGQQCNITGIVESFHRLTIIDTSLSVNYENATVAVTDDTLFVCGWKGYNTSCDYMTKAQMTFQPIPVWFDHKRRDFAMHAFGGRICVFGGIWVAGDSNRTLTECAVIYHNQTGLNFTAVTNSNVPWHYGEGASLQVEGSILFCKYMGVSNDPVPLCKWHWQEGEFKNESLYGSRFWKDIKVSKSIEVALALYGSTVTMMYSESHGTPQLISVFVNKSLEIETIRRQLDVSPFQDVQLVQIRKDCAEDKVDAIFEPGVSVAGCKCPSVETRNNPCHVESTSENPSVTHPLHSSEPEVYVKQNQTNGTTTQVSQNSNVSIQLTTNGSTTTELPREASPPFLTIKITLEYLIISICFALATICIGIAITICVMKYHYSKRERKLQTQLSALLNDPTLSYDCVPESIDSVDHSHQPPVRKPILLPHYDNPVEESKESLQGSVTPGLDSSSIKSIGKLLEKGQIVASGLANCIDGADQKTEDRINSNQSMSSATPSGESVHRMNSRAEQSTSESFVPYEDLALQIVKRIWRSKLKDKAAEKVKNVPHNCSFN